jgi:hypothetical protein
MRAAYKIDRLIDDNVPPLRKLYRHVIIAGASKKAAAATASTFTPTRAAVC